MLIWDSLDTQNLSCWSIALTPKMRVLLLCLHHPQALQTNSAPCCACLENSRLPHNASVAWSDNSSFESHRTVHGNNLGLEGPRGNGNGAAPPGAGTKTSASTAHLSISLLLWFVLSQTSAEHLWTGFAAGFSSISCWRDVNCKRICVTANQHDASSIVKLTLPLNLPAPRNDNMTQKTSKNPQCGFPYRPYVLPPFSSDSILVRAGRNFSRKISCSNAVRGIFRWLLSWDLPFHLGIGHHGHHHYKHSFASRDIKFLGATFCWALSCWACKCCKFSSDTSFISTTVSRCWSASSSAGSCSHVHQICLKGPS